jgi:hypothetical protein
MRKKLGHILTTMPTGKPLNLYGIGIERMPVGLFKVTGYQNLLTWNEAANHILYAKMNQEPSQTPIPDTPEYPDWLRCMSLHFPWAWLIAKGYKSEEFRSKTVTYRNIFLLHASQSKASDDVIREFNIPRNQIIRGAIIGAATITDSNYEMIDGYSTAVHLLDNAIYFPEPITNISGQIQQLWKPKDTPTVRAFNKAWRMIKDLT